MAQAQRESSGSVTYLEPGNGLRDRVRAVLPQVAANAERGEQERRVPPENIALLKQAGLYRAFQPSRYGGLEVTLSECAPILSEVAEACVATSWVSGLLVIHAHVLGLFTRQVQDDVWADSPDALIGSSVAPIGKAEIVDGGVLLSGKFGFSSGCDHADWYILGFKHPGFESADHAQYAIVPRSDVTIVDDWFTEGMRGTGSKSLLVDKAFVPDHRMESIFALNTGQSRGFGSNESALYHAAFIPFFASSFPATAIGAARRIIEVYKDKVKSRIKVYTGAKAVTRSPAAMRLARAVHATDAAEALAKRDWAEIDAACAARRMPSPDEMSRWMTDPSYCIQLAIEAADALFNSAGGSAWFSSNEMQRLWRNIHMSGSHAYTDYDTCSEIYGRQLLGLERDPALG